MRDIFTRDERAVVLFLVVALSVGGLVLSARRVRPDLTARPDARGVPEETEELDRPEGPVDINSADAAELERLPGVGPVRAQAILALRSSRGRFASVDDLIDVKGIGPVTLERIRSEAFVGGSSDSAATGLPRENTEWSDVGDDERRTVHEAPRSRTIPDSGRRGGDGVRRQ